MGMHAINRFICARRDIWLDLGKAESRWLRTKLDATSLTAPVYITGLARGGTSVMLEMLAQAEGVATHTYRDFPLLLTPYVVRRFYAAFDRFDFGTPRRIERAHKDRLLITPRSPESMEEVLWMSFFTTLHDETRSNLLTEKTSLPPFERFYTDHIKKLLLAERATRYVSKANYNFTRIRYLRTLFPDARFVVLLRDPIWHVASLMKQHRLFCAEQEKNPTALEHTDLTGHFEFGLNRRLIHAGDDTKMSAIQSAFAQGREAEAWARYWESLYAYGLTLLYDPALHGALLVVHYEDLCTAPQAMLEKIFSFAGLRCDENKKRAMAETLSAPEYYRPTFDAQETQRIRDITANTYAAYKGL